MLQSNIIRFIFRDIAMESSGLFKREAYRVKVIKAESETPIYLFTTASGKRQHQIQRYYCNGCNQRWTLRNHWLIKSW